MKNIFAGILTVALSGAAFAGPMEDFNRVTHSDSAVPGFYSHYVLSAVGYLPSSNPVAGECDVTEVKSKIYVFDNGMGLSWLPTSDTRYCSQLGAYDPIFVSGR